MHQIEKNVMITMSTVHVFIPCTEVGCPGLLEMSGFKFVQANHYTLQLKVLGFV